jgi:hypothetical protein
MRILLACLLASCCPRPPETLVVQTAEIRANGDGSYTVTDGWMAARLRYEQGLLQALERCEGSK